MAKISGKKGPANGSWLMNHFPWNHFNPPIVKKFIKRRVKRLTRELRKAEEIKFMGSGRYGNIEFGFPKKTIGISGFMLQAKLDKTRFLKGDWNLPKWEGEMSLKGSDTPFLRMVEGGEEKLQDVHIIPMDNGFVINVGCAHFVETSWARISKALELYWKDPVAARKKYWKKR